MTHSDLVDEVEAVLPQHLLSSQLRADSGLRLGLHAQLGLIFREGWGLLEGLGEGRPSGVFTGQVAHLTQWSRLGVNEGAELAHPLGTRKRRGNAEDILCRKDALLSAERQTCLGVSADRDPGLGSNTATGGRVARRGRSHTSQRMLPP